MSSWPVRKPWFVVTIRDHAKVFPPIVDVAAGSVSPAGSIEAPRSSVWKSASVRSDRASRTAPSMFSCPAPCWYMFAPAIGRAEYCRIALIAFGVSYEYYNRMFSTTYYPERTTTVGHPNWR